MRLAKITWTWLALCGVLSACGDDDGKEAASGYALLVADRTAERVYVYDDEHTLKATLNDQVMADHVGFLPLGDGRALYLNEKASELVELSVGDLAAPSIERRAKIPRAAFYAHLAVDPEGRYAVVTGSDESYTQVTLSLITLDSFKVVSRDVVGAEAGVFLSGDLLYVREGGNPDAMPPIEPELRVYEIKALLAGDAEPVSTLSLGPGPHGESMVHARDKFYVATDDGMEVIAIQGKALSREKVIPWSVDGRDFGRAFYVRLSQNGRHLITYVRSFQENWWESDNDAYLIDLETEQATRIPFGKGLTYRCAQAGSHAVYYRLSPDGDEGYLVDIDASSDDFMKVTAKFALPELRKAAGRERSVWEAEGFRATAMSPDGAKAYISNGSNGTISVVDAVTGEIAETIETPSALDFGGYMVTVPVGGEAPADTIGR